MRLQITNRANFRGEALRIRFQSIILPPNRIWQQWASSRMDTLFWCGPPVCNITETSISATDRFQMAAFLNVEEPLPPPKPFDHCRPKAKPNIVRRIVREISDDACRIRYSFHAPTTRPVHNRNIGSSLHETERQDQIRPENGVQHSAKLDSLLRGL